MAGGGLFAGGAQSQQTAGLFGNSGNNSRQRTGPLFGSKAQNKASSIPGDGNTTGGGLFGSKPSNNSQGMLNYLI